VGDDGFRDRLELDDRTGDLTITNTRMNNLKYTVGDSVTLQTGVTEIFFLMWMYGSQNNIIAKIDGKTQIFSLYDVDDGRFEDRLQLDNKTGSLIISDIRTKHSGDYHLKIINVIFAGLENKKEGDSVTLHTGVTDSQKHDLILWTFGPKNPDRRLHLENQTGSLTIRDVRTTDAGVYQLQISNSKETLYKRFNVFVEKKTVSVSEGNSVTLKTGATKIQRDNEVLWMFGSQDTVIAQIYKKAGNISYADDERFRDKLQLDHQTGDLTISDIRIPISGDYQMKITSSRLTKMKRFKVIVRGEIF
uniref:Immunoglobulin domain-containing protein n=1 Tax=Sinocyclocheilus anshuiensis TaxID=1608454 RepID=A0A671QQQ4_9TELE